ncbi:MAG: hypothetical protein GY863_10525 [bacterium]|nr:hypothetical protein [bacterium]
MKSYFDGKLKNKLLVNYSETSGRIQIPVNRSRFFLWIQIAFLLIVTVVVVIWKIDSNLINNNNMLKSRIELTESLLKNFEDQVSTLNDVKDRIGSLNIDNEIDDQRLKTLSNTGSENEDTKKTQKTGGK